MAPNKMLIDATHPEETRVVVLRNGRVEEFDYESAARKLLRGNIYLAKVTRVEPSLQAAFVDYGGNRHGFLAFNEIHPDYYQIPMADRQALIEEEALAEAEEEAAADARAERLARRRRSGGRGRSASGSDEDAAQRDDAGGAADGEDSDDDEEGARVVMIEDVGDDEDDLDADDDEHHDDEPHDDGDEDERGPQTIAQATQRDDVLTEEVSDAEAPQGGNGGDQDAAAPEAVSGEAAVVEAAAEADAARDTSNGGDHDEAGGVQEVASVAVEAEAVESVGSEDALEELPSRPRRRPRSYKIQEVIKRRQVILVQVVKEERGNKGAALTTYLSLAGRYTVLMPNTARGGGISRKITQPQDRKRLKAIAQELEVPEGMGLIIRTAGAARTKQEIKRDFEYLLRLWESVRDLTLESTAPSLVYEEGNLIKRSIRDLYNKDVDEIVVAGDHAHKDAKDFMRMLMPSHAKNVLAHQDAEPLFTKYGIERQLNAMFSPYVTLKSGGYLVINQTEALVAIDVNSGKATREFSIEETALNTNLEASDEIARQLKLRDLAGLIVIDFIDMEEKRNNRAVERRLKDALRFDRARIQLGRISHFGLMEMSRQRLRSGVLEGSTSQCPHCQGTGIIRSTESVALAVLRGLEDALMAGARTSLVATTTSAVALYILNNKRHFINEMETRHGIFVTVQASDKLQGANFVIEKGQTAPVASRRPDRAAVNMDWGFEGETFEADADAGDGEAEQPRAAREEGGREGGRRRRRRRGRRDGGRSEMRGGRDEAELGYDDQDDEHVGGEDAGPVEVVDDDDDGYADDAPAPREARSEGSEEGGNGRRRRRGRRGGRRGRDRARGANGSADAHEATDNADAADSVAPGNGSDAQAGDQGADTFQPEALQVDGEVAVDDVVAAEVVTEDAAERSEPRRSSPRRRSSEAKAAEADAADAPEAAPSSEAEAATDAEEAPAPTRSRRSAGAAQAEKAESVAAVPEETAPPAVEDSVVARVRARSEASSEPKLERVVVSSGEASAAEISAEESPVRRGWWQRRLGS
ncbi:ribonuclease E [Hyphomicrobium nitrativorans NL23]|uniref:Ribonuclease E n=1 Tax=Hyphomicrobium nitrativorans NL23 TaxID=1029756 RepID=V5SCY3_9HYPH|nr:ribonuclease E/G [Hyphomicrobium nitrativorans]AHB47915.1 ribonuclease E [Hyphomicrobium nitrativorans NL23]